MRSALRAVAGEEQRELLADGKGIRALVRPPARRRVHDHRSDGGVHVDDCGSGIRKCRTAIIQQEVLFDFEEGESPGKLNKETRKEQSLLRTYIPKKTLCS